MTQLINKIDDTITNKKTWGEHKLDRNVKSNKVRGVPKIGRNAKNNQTVVDPKVDRNAKNKKAWDDLYRRNQDYVWGESPMEFVEEFLQQHKVKMSPNENILDAAAGEGRNLESLLKLGGQVFACDASSSAINKMRKRKGDFTCYHCDLAQTPFESNFFDFVLLTDAIETLPDLEGVLKELLRVLKPGGKLLCNIPGKEDGIAEIEMESLTETSYLYKNEFFYRFLSEQEATDLLERHGFSIVENYLFHWNEDPHPGFREQEHTHTSQIFLLQK